MKNLLLLSIIISLCSSCNLYKPGRANIPILEGQNDANLSVSMGRNFGVEASYSPINHTGVIANYTNGFQDFEYRDDGISDQRLVNKFNNQQYEFGLGYYTRIDTNSYFEVYLGYGIGESGVANDYDGFFYTNQMAYEAMHEHFFIQPTYAYDYNESLSIRFTGKLAVINFYDINSSPYYPLSKSDLFDKTFTSFQPSISLLKKEDFIDFSWQMGLYLSPEKGFYSNRWINTSLAIGVNISRLRNKIKGNNR
jgi:hypothetical protein